MIAVIGDRETAIGFRLAGVRDTYEVEHDGVEVVRLLDKLVRDGATIILITERLAAESHVRARIREINGTKREVTPIIIEIPDKKGPTGEGAAEIELLIRRAVGVALK